jgi:hypothetical protein
LAARGERDKASRFLHETRFNYSRVHLWVERDQTWQRLPVPAATAEQYQRLNESSLTYRVVKSIASTTPAAGDFTLVIGLSIACLTLRVLQAPLLVEAMSSGHRLWYAGWLFLEVAGFIAVAGAARHWDMVLDIPGEEKSIVIVIVVVTAMISSPPVYVWFLAAAVKALKVRPVGMAELSRAARLRWKVVLLASVAWFFAWPVTVLVTTLVAYGSLVMGSFGVLFLGTFCATGLALLFGSGALVGVIDRRRAMIASEGAGLRR